MPKIQYFLGANSPKGFYSLYDQLIDIESARAVYILKGGPGCGKSTLMRCVGRILEENGEKAEYILCSGDPDSLDAVIFPDRKTAIVDGTAPHVVEPKYPGLVERYINLGDCYDSRGLQRVRRELMGCMTGYKECYQRAYRCLDAAAQIGADCRDTLLTPQLEQRLCKRAQGILSREIPRKKGAAPGQVRKRFLSAVTHKGPVALFDTAQAVGGRIYDLADDCGLAHTMLTWLLAGAVEEGYDAIACPSPMAPERLEHLLLPELGLCFVTSTHALACPGTPYRRLRLDAMADGELLRASRPRLRFARKVSQALVEEAVSSLRQAKEMHDELEGLYNPYVDFKQVERIARAVAEEILE